MRNKFCLLLYKSNILSNNLIIFINISPLFIFILEESGSSWDQLVDVTVFLVNMKRDFQTYNRIYADYFKDNLPCRTTVEISSLPTPIAIELKCIATIE